MDKKKYSSEKYLDLFNITYEDTREERIESLRRDKDVLLYRVKTIISGQVLESEIYPVWKNATQSNKAKRAMASRTAQKNLNDKNAKKTFIRKVNTNFNDKDIMVTLSYKGKAPDEEEARKDIQNYIRKVRNYRKKNNLEELKYIYVIEYSTEAVKKKRIHFHVIMNNMDRDVAEKMWGKGWANCKRLQPDEFGFEALARYITKDPKGTKRWCGSRNLKEPIVRVADHKISKKRAEKIAKDVATAPDMFEKQYKGYRFNDITVKYSDFISGAYLYVRMRKSDIGSTRNYKKHEFKKD